MNKNALKLAKVLNDKEAIDSLTYALPTFFPYITKETSKQIIDLMTSKENMRYLNESYAQFFLSIFNDKEIASLVKFFSSKVGKKWRHKMVEVFRELAQRGKKWGEDVIKKDMDKFLKIMDNDKKINPISSPIVLDDSGSNRSVLNDSGFHERMFFALNYAIKKGWDLKNLTTEQVMEIRKQDGWINNGGE